MNLRSFLEQMETKGKISHVKDEVSKRFEIPFIIKKTDNEGPVLLFEKVKNHKTKVVANVCGTRKRIARAKLMDHMFFGMCSPKVLLTSYYANNLQVVFKKRPESWLKIIKRRGD